MTGALDAYSRRARLQPVLLCAAPLAVAAFAVGVTETWLARIATGSVTFGIAAVLIAAARDRGVQLQERLWESWGGPPTTTLLLSTSPTPSPHLQRHRDHAHRLLPGLGLLTDDRDRDDPAGSREAINRYIVHLRERTRDVATFPVVQDANADYGFRRNVFALRPVALVVSLAAVAGSLLALVAILAGALGRAPAPVVVAAVACSAAALWWWRLGPAWVRVQADRYANALFDAAELLAPVGSPTMSSEAAT